MAIEKLIKIVKKGKAETSRKAICNFLDYAGVKNINAPQNKLSASALANSESNTGGMSDSEVEEELREIKDLLNEK